LNEEAEDYATAAAPSIASLADDKQVVIIDPSGAPVESLLEYLDGYAIKDAMVFCDVHSMHSLPRQPTLFSAYATFQRPRQIGASDVQRDTDREACAIWTKSSLGVDPDVRITPHVPPEISTGFSMRRQDLRKRDSIPFASPHAPESARGTVAWLQNLCYKVSHTSAVVARPSPERFENMHERERPPSEEAALERSLRAAEMAYCNGSWHNCVTYVKTLLHSLETAASVTPKALKIVSFGGPSASTLDDDLRCHQCCGRLSRLVCRLAQRCDELCAAELLHATNTKKQLDLPHRLSAPPHPLDARDLAAFRHGTAALLGDIDDAFLRAKSKLMVDEAVAHLALVKTNPVSRRVFVRRYTHAQHEDPYVSKYATGAHHHPFVVGAGVGLSHRYLDRVLRPRLM
jgi:hypothetical protein